MANLANKILSLNFFSMKKLTYLLFLSLLVFFVACGSKDPKKLIVKKWKIDTEELKKTMKAEIEKMKKEKPEEAKMAEGMLEMGMNLFSSMTMEFKADGTFETIAMGQTQKGKWEISSDGKTLSTTEEGKEKKSINLKEITTSKMVIENPEGAKAGAMGSLTFVPAK